MTDRSVKPDPGAHGEAPLPACCTQYSYIHMYDLLRGKYDIQRFLRIFRDLQAPCEIIARPDRNVSESHFPRFSDPVDHFIHGAVSSQDHDPVLLPVRCDPSGDLPRMIPALCHVAAIIHTLFLKFRFDHPPYHLAHPRAGFRVYNKMIFHLRRPYPLQSAASRYLPSDLAMFPSKSASPCFTHHSKTFPITIILISVVNSSMLSFRLTIPACSAFST